MTIKMRKQRDLLVQLVVDLAWRLGMNTGAVLKEGSVQHLLQLPRVGVVSWLVEKENATGSPLAWLDEVEEISPETWAKISTYLEGKIQEGKTQGGWGTENSLDTLPTSAAVTEQKKEASATEETRKPIEKDVLPDVALSDKTSGGEVEKVFLEDGEGTCVCKECGYAAAHKKGAACVDRYCPDCSAPLEGTPAKVKSWKDKFSALWASLGQLLTKEFDTPEEPKGENSFFTVKQADGRFRWVSISSTAYLDREYDIVSTKALEKSASSHRGNRGPLRFWHVPGVDFGSCDFALHDGLSLIESGLWSVDPVSTKMREKTGEDPDFWGMSIAFLADNRTTERNVNVNGRRVNRVFHNIAILERSLLPAKFAANTFSRITTEGESEMEPHKIAILRAALGDELAEVAIAQADGINAKSVEPNAIFKETSRDDVAAALLKMVDAEQDEELKKVLKSAAAFVSDTPEQEEKEASEPDPNDVFIEAMGDLPDCELKDAFLELAEKASKKKKASDDEEDEEDEEVTEHAKAKGSSEPVPDATPAASGTSDAEDKEVLVGLVKSMSAQMASLSLQVTALTGNQSTRASLNRPSANPGTIDHTATLAAKEAADAADDKGNGVVDDMGKALMGTFLGEE